MKSVKIEPGKLNGTIGIPPSKSLSHRAVIAAALSNGESNIDNLIFSDDINATWAGMEKLGGIIEKTGPRTLKIKGQKPQNKEQIIDCIESGSTLRFLIPISLLWNNKTTFIGQGKLVSRPLDGYYKILDDQKIKYTNNNGELPLSLEGTISPGTFEIEGNISSQFITGLMFTLPLLKEDSKIIIINELESKGYVDLTIDILNKFGIEIINNNDQEFIIKGNQEYKNKDYTIEGDFSQGAFWIVGGILGETINSKNLKIDSLQGDKVIIDLVKEMGGDIEINQDFIKTSKSKTKGITIDASQCPDIIPIMTVLAALSEGQTNIINASRLRIKESDRLTAISTELNKLGADVVEVGDSLVINGKPSLRGGIVDSWNDHRIAMALAIASIKATGEVTITNSDAVNKSYPDFWEDFKSLGGQVHEFNMGNNIKISIFGESHGSAIGVNIDGLPPGIELDMEDIKSEMKRRAPGKDKISTPRQEKDEFEILSGYFNNKTTGTPLSIIIRNKDNKSKDYEKTKDLPRPGHADFTGSIKYEGFNDYRGGGHFSGRITAPLVFAGSIAKQILKMKNIIVGSHIKSIGEVEEESFNENNLSAQTLENLKNKRFPTIDDEKALEMEKVILMAKEEEDSVGGIIEACVLNVMPGLGSPFFDSVESRISQMIFSIPGVKAIEFGQGFNISKIKGSQANDEMYLDGKTIKTYTNNNGGILGGITSGMPIVFKVAFKPTPSIGKNQRTIDMKKNENTELKIIGRHDPCIVVRAIPVVEAATALVILDLIMEMNKNNGLFKRT